jgi:hypothetical protein
MEAAKGPKLGCRDTGKIKCCAELCAAASALVDCLCFAEVTFELIMKFSSGFVLIHIVELRRYLNGEEAAPALENRN